MSDGPVRKWQLTVCAMFEFDLFVIGGGSGGVRAARLAAEAGVRVGLAEEYRLGGTCVIRGCVPKKLMVYASEFSAAFLDAEGFGWTVGERHFDWGRFVSAKDREISRLEAFYRSNLERAGVRIFDARAEFEDAHSLCLSSGKQVTSRHILIATGGRPFIPEVPGAQRAVTSNEIFQLDSLPGRVLIVGGGYIACEFAGILHGMGCAVEQWYRGDQILRGFDNEIRSHVFEAMSERGIEIRLGEKVSRIEEAPYGLKARSNSGRERDFDLVMYATGRRPNTSSLGLERTGVKLGRKGEIIVDEYSQSSVPSIFAVGDVTDRINLTPVAIREGAAFVETVFRGNPTAVDHACVPSAVFTRPEVGTVGMSEEQAAAAEPVEVYSTTFRPLANALSGNNERMLMKLVVSKETGTVLGVHIVGHAAAEMIQLAGIAVKLGATKEDFNRTIAVHPTTAEELVTFREPARAT